MPRYTTLNFEEIVEKLEKGDIEILCCSCGGKGLWLNELGELGKQGDERAEKELIKLIRNDKDMIARCNAAGWLGRIGTTQEALELLEDFLEELKGGEKIVEESMVTLRTRIAEKN